MFIVLQSRRGIVNVDTVKRLYVYRDSVYALFSPGEETALGKYESNTRADEVFQLLVSAIAPMDEVKEYEPGVQAIYMPEE